jgi:hypothetical protein
MRKVLRVSALIAAGMALLSCAQRPAEVAYAPPPEADAPPPVVRAPLPPVAYAPPPPGYGARGYAPPPDYAGPPPVAYAPRPPMGYAPPPPEAYAPPPGPYGRRSYAQSEPPPAGSMKWQASKRWAEVKPGAGASTVGQDQNTKFKAAQAKAAKVGVENLTKEDVDGLTVAQIKELRGY